MGSNRDTRRCPTCNTKASLNDIRILYAKQLIAIDTAELTALEHKLLEVRKIYYTKLNNNYISFYLSLKLKKIRFFKFINCFNLF